jgi:two-component system sensor histidine kinase/response regulator
MAVQLDERRASLLETQAELRERMELSCLYDVFRITERDDIGLEEMLRTVSERLPCLTPRNVSGSSNVALCASARRCRAERSSGHTSTVSAASWRASASVTCSRRTRMRRALPGGELIDAIAVRLAGVIARRDAVALAEDKRALIQAIFDQAPDAIELADMRDAALHRGQ